MINTPDKWLILKLDDDTYHVFATWNGGYLDSDRWRASTSIQKVTLSETKRGLIYTFTTKSGTVYKCKDSLYGTTSYGNSVLANNDRLVPQPNKDWTKVIK